MWLCMYVCMYVCMLLMAGQTAGPFGPKLSEVTAGTPGMVLGRPAGRSVFDAI
jgi:hypothetical protein